MLDTERIFRGVFVLTHSQPPSSVSIHVRLAQRAVGSTSDFSRYNVEQPSCDWPTLYISSAPPSPADKFPCLTSLLGPSVVLYVCVCPSFVQASLYMHRSQTITFVCMLSKLWLLQQTVSCFATRTAAHTSSSACFRSCGVATQLVQQPIPSFRKPLVQTFNV